MCMCVLPEFLSVNHLGARSAQKRALDPSELDLETFVSHHVGAENRAQVLWRGSKCSDH